jgi:ADP-heptose:LPS heptosyltransferase
VKVEKLVVFRGLYLGDLVAATGALRALRYGYPWAEITLVSLPWAKALAPHLPHVDRLLSYPGAPGLDGGESKGALEEFLVRMQAEKFALAVNMHGRGPISTRLVARFGARRVAGFANEEAPTLEVEVPWDAEAHESCKLLLLALVAGGAPAGPEPELRIRTEDYERAQALLPAHLRRRPLALVHPGASAPEKCWPEEGFGWVAEGLARQEYAVAVTGSMEERELTYRVSEKAAGSLNLGGKTDLSTLIALVGRASVVVSNDTGPAHLAYALRTPSVTLFGPTTDVERWGPLDRRLHTVLREDPISDISAGEVLQNVESLGARQERSA